MTMIRPQAPVAPKLSLRALCKTYPGAEIAAVDHVALDLQPGQTLALLGASGCGKSTTLNMIVGLEQPSSGDILVDGRSVVAVPPGQRNIGLVFQDYAVFTAMSVRQNLAFGLAVRKTPRAQIDRAVAEVAELLGLTGQLSARAADLGGSELQRVAIGRTLVTRPAILLLDEPLSNLESGARLTMRRELRRLQRDTGLTLIYVTHDQLEALSLADQIAVMSAGKIRQIAPAAEILREPAHHFVASFLGEPPINLIAGRLVGGWFQADGGLRLPLEGITPDAAGLRLSLGLRPQALRLVAPGAGALQGRLIHSEPRGPESVLTLECQGRAIKLVLPRPGHASAQPRLGHILAHPRLGDDLVITDPVLGQDYGLAFGPDALLAFDGDSNLRLPAALSLRNLP